MSLVYESAEARKTDQFATVLRESGKYTGIITRAEKLLSKNGTQGLGISFKSDDGETANYLDLYTVKANGEKLIGMGFAQAILCCTRTKEAKEGIIECDKWDNDEGRMKSVKVNGYPSLIGAKIGFVLQRELQTHHINGTDVERLRIASVFEAATGLSSSEIIDGKTKPQKADRVARYVEMNPVVDRRKKSAAPAPQTTKVPAVAADMAGFDDDIPF